MNSTESYGHEYFMRKCIALAQVAKRRGDSPVGSILVLTGQIVAQGIEGGKTHKDITFHAEIEAIRRATESLKTQDFSSCTMYTTHEPCIMCSYVIRYAKIQTVVIGLLTDEIGGFSSCFPLLLDTTIKKWSKPPIIIRGILEMECRKLND
jgi:tRNA(adenine34) deaminase